MFNVSRFYGNLFVTISIIILLLISNISTTGQVISIKQGFLFYNPSSNIPLEGLFVEKKIKVSNSWEINLNELNQERDTGYLIPLFFLSWQKTDFRDLFAQGYVIYDLNRQHSDLNFKGFCRVLPINLTFIKSSTFKGLNNEDGLYKREIFFKNKKIIFTCKDLPFEWGSLKDLQIIQFSF